MMHSPTHIKIWLKCSNSSIKQKGRKIGNEGTSESVWESFVSTRARMLPISGTMVQEHNKWLNIYFSTSNGWLANLRKRHQIVFQKVCHGAGNVCEETVT